MTYVQVLEKDLMTPQAFSYGTLGSNNMIYLPPYGLTESINYMLKLNPVTYSIKKIPLNVDNSTEKWTTGILHNEKLYFLPYNEGRILIVDCNTDDVSYINIGFKERGKYIQGHLYKDKIIALPYGAEDEFDFALIFDTTTKSILFKNIQCDINDKKKWHTTQLLGNTIYGLPRGERIEKPYFPYRIEFNCDNSSYKLANMSPMWFEIDEEGYSNKKYTTLAKANNKLYAPPYSENKNFDLLCTYINGKWHYEHTGLKETSRKYYSHTTAKNGKIYFPPAGHEEDWSEMLVIDSNSDTLVYYIHDLNIGKESKKYFAGCENSQGKIYYIPRGGCVCEPESNWKQYGDLTEVLVIDTNNDTHYTIDISEYFTDNTTIEKYNQCLLVNDVIFAFPYGESDSFQTILVFDTLTEKVIKTIDLNEL